MLEKLPLISEAVGYLEFYSFDGHKIPMPDNSIDRVVIMDAFHHIPNQAEILLEFKRVLRPGGFAIMSEPGPNHSKSAQAQSEMQKYRVLESDLIIEEIERIGKKSGFISTEVGISCPVPSFETIDKFNNCLIGVDDRYLAVLTKNYLENHRLVRLRTFGKEERDSRHRQGLSCLIEGKLSDTHLSLAIKNTGSNSWLPSGDTPGCVNLGIHKLKPDSSIDMLGCQRITLSSAFVKPGEMVNLALPLKEIITNGLVAFDLVAEQVTWFSWNGDKTLKIELP